MNGENQERFTESFLMFFAFANYFSNCMADIQIEFEWKGKQVKGILQSWGADGRTWYLMIDGKYRGQLFKPYGGDWNFYTERGLFPEWGKVFASFLPKKPI